VTGRGGSDTKKKSRGCPGEPRLCPPKAQPHPRSGSREGNGRWFSA